MEKVTFLGGKKKRSPRLNYENFDEAVSSEITNNIWFAGFECFNPNPVCDHMPMLHSITKSVEHC